MKLEPMPHVGDLAPDFTLRDQDKEPVTLSDLRGGPVILVFVQDVVHDGQTRRGATPARRTRLSDRHAVRRRALPRVPA
jgi:hypothetical protein